MRALKLGLTCMLMLVLNVGMAKSGEITLDFDTPATGSEIVSTPLVTPFGIISAVDVELNSPSDPEFIAAGASGNVIDHLGGVSSLLFDFDVDSIQLIYGGNGGNITIQTRNAFGDILDSFFQADTDSGQPAGPITLNGPAIRKLEWFESSGSFAVLDNIQITTGDSGVPEPSTIVLLLTGGVGLIGYSWRRKKQLAA